MWSVKTWPKPWVAAEVAGDAAGDGAEMVSLAMGRLWHNWPMQKRATSARSGAVDAVVAAIGPWAQGRGPLFRQLARAIASAVERGALADDLRLPSERALAAALAIGRGTAVAAYDALVEDGLIERRRGSGTFVAVTDQPRLPQGREGSALVHRLVERSDPSSALVDLSISVLRDASALPDVAVATDDLAGVVPDTGYTPWGLPALRRAIAAHVSAWGLPTTEQQIVVTTGAQQAISAAAACWVRPGDTVVVDDPTYPGAIAAFTQAGARLVGAAADRYGVRVDALDALLASRPALVYVQSTVHSPTGAILPATRRRAIAALAADRHVPLIEDVALADLAWEPSPPPIAAEAPHASIALVGSLSKLFWGGLRVGFVRAPEPLALRFARIKATHDLGSSAVSQVMAERLLASAPASATRARRTDELRARCDVLQAALRRVLPSWSWPEPRGGLSLWVKTPAASADAFAQHALRYDVAVATAGALSPSSAYDDHLRLSFAGPPDELEEGVDRLAAAWRSWR
jgi:DNA-binding transcriptional MocR family regulator